MMIDGSVDIFLWEDKQQSTEGLWEPGKLVTVSGNLRVRDDEFSVSCSEAKEFLVSDIPTQESNVELEKELDAAWKNIRGGLLAQVFKRLTPSGIQRR